MLVPTSDLENVTSQLLERSGNLGGKRILITGSSGFIGSWLSHGLAHLSANLNLDLELIFLSRNINDEFRKSIFKIGNAKNEFIETDLSIDNLTEFNSLKNTDIVFHTATTVKKLETQFSEMEERRIVSATTNLIDAIKDSKKSPVFIHLSSGAVYGHHSNNPDLISENPQFSRDNRISSYGSIKIQIEELVNAASSAGIVIGSNPRLFSFFGPLLPLQAHFAIGNFVDKAIQGKDIELTGNPESSRSYLYATDLVRKLIILSNRPTLNTVHIGSKNRISISDLALTVKKNINNKVKVNSLNLHLEANHYVPSVEESNKYLNDSSEISLDEGLLTWKKWLTTKK